METAVIIVGSLLLLLGSVAALRYFINYGHAAYSYFRLERESRLISQDAMKSVLNDL